MTDLVTLYGLPHSLYTGRVRAYLRKQRTAYREVPPGDPRFAERIVPAIRRGIIPVVELPDGTVIQDTVDIIDHFEDRNPVLPARPPGAVQRALAHLFELYAVLGLTRHAMHYRWSYLDRQRTFLRDAFGTASDPERTEATMARMNSYLPMLGVTKRTIPQIEQSYGELLDGLNGHFTNQPYLFGAIPSLGDYALFGPLFAHLGRDPVPLAIMQNRAPRVFRWVERMHAPDLDLVDFTRAEPGYLPGDAVADSLLPVLTQIAGEIGPGLSDRLAFLRDYAADNELIPGEPVTAKPHQRIIGAVETSFRGVPYEGGVQPYTFFLWQRLLDAATPEVRVWFGRHGLESLLTADLPIRVERSEHIEVWGERPR